MALVEVRSWHEVSTDEDNGAMILAHVVYDHETLASFIEAHPPRSVQLRTFVGDERADHVVNPPGWTTPASDQGEQ